MRKKFGMTIAIPRMLDASELSPAMINYPQILIRIGADFMRAD